MERISVVGAGYVGLVSGACLASLGHRVACVDVDETRIAQVQRGVAPFHEPGLGALLQSGLESGRFTATLDLETAIAASEVTIIAVGTPFNDGAIDLSYLRQCSTRIGLALARLERFHVIAVKSTPVPGTTDNVVTPLLAQHSGKQPAADFGVGMIPEFLREGSAVADFMTPDRIICGAGDERTFDMLARVMSVFPGVPLVRTSVKTAEMIKCASNALLASLVSFSNELAILCQHIGGIDVVDVMKGIHLDHRFTSPGQNGARQPAGIVEYLRAGCGYGGSCLPKDLKALIAEARRQGHAPQLLQAVGSVNDGQPAQMITLLKKHYPALAGRRVAVLGLAFKAGTDDVRESSALKIVELLRGEGAEVTAYDPLVSADSHPSLAGIRIGRDLDSVVADADAVLLVTAWPDFKRLERIVPMMPSQPVIVDGRRVLDKLRFARYEGIGLGQDRTVVSQGS